MSDTYITRESRKVDKDGWGPMRDGKYPDGRGGRPTFKEAEAIAAELRAKVEGDVRFDAGTCAMYAVDSSNFRQVPIGVVLPRSKEDVVNTMAVARAHGAPILARGCGTSLAGQCCNVAIVMDFSRYLHNVLEIDKEAKLGRVQPGCILDHLRDTAKEYGLTFGPDPSTHDHCTMGGMIGNDSCGVHSVMAAFAGNGARTADNLQDMEILTYDGVRMWVGQTSEDELRRIIHEGGRRGEIYARVKAFRDKYADLIREKFPHIPRCVSGYNLPELLPEKGFHLARALVGSESTLVTVLEARMKLIYNPPVRTLLVLGYPSVYDAGDHVPQLMSFHPTGCEGMDNNLVDDMKKNHIHPKQAKLLPPGGGWLMVEFGGESKAESDQKAKDCMEALKKTPNPPSMKLFTDPWEERQLWIVRESGLGATARVPGEPDTWEGWEDSAVPPDKVGDYLRDLRALFNRFDYNCALYGHFGQGCIHTRIDFDLLSEPGIEKYKRFMEAAADLCVSYGGSLSGEHGDGQSRGWLLPRMFGDELVRAFSEFKRIFDPEWKMNPGKVVQPYGPDQNLRLGPHYNAPQPMTHFQFPDDDGSFSRAVLRCVGVGECRRMDGGTMCPSFMVTREEEDSTRGRSRMLFEMLQGEVIPGDWHNDQVREALDLCLACKGCLHDCPMHVDMATYKAEFYSHYYDGKLRPRQAYAMGWIMHAARLAAKMPGVANFLTHAPGLDRLAKWVAGIAQERTVPAFAHESFQDWFQRRAPVNEGRPKVILWPDTFNNHFHPETAKAAVEVLEDAGYHVAVPDGFVCCGRPLYDWGMLDEAKAMLCGILDRFQPEIEAGTPVIGLEPSCVAVFRNEMMNMLPNDADAKRLNGRFFTLAEFLMEHANGYTPPKLNRKMVLHGHCHHKNVMKMDADCKLLTAMGVDFDFLDDGCCGMAGSFGFEEGDHYDISMKAGERVLLPRVRDAKDDTLILTDGFSCREQIQQGTDRRALHIAQVLQMALHDGETGAQGAFPERGYVPDNESAAIHAARVALGAGAAALAAGALAVTLWKSHKTND